MSDGGRGAGDRAFLDLFTEPLGVPASAFCAPLRSGETAEMADAKRIADLMTDPQGRRIARAFLDVADPAGRRAIADTVVSIAGAFNLHGGGERG